MNDNFFRAFFRPWAMADSGSGGGGGGDVEAAKDPGALKSHSSITDAEMMGKGQS